MLHLRLHFPPSNTLGAEKNPYKFGGKEYETANALNQYDFEARTHLAALCLFSTPDPKAHKTPDVSPYLYCAANPIMFIDPTGERLTFNYTNSDGETREYDYIFRDDKIVAVDKEGNEVNLASSSEVKLLNQLNELASYNVGKDALTTIIDNEETITVKLANNSSENRFNENEKTIYFDVDTNEGGLSYDLRTFSREIRAFVPLGHEVFHAEDFIKGTLDSSIWCITKGGEPIYNSEKYACDKENQLRREAGLPERVSYLTRKSINPTTGVTTYNIDWKTYLLKSKR